MFPPEIIHLCFVAIVEPDFSGVDFRSQDWKFIALSTYGADLPADGSRTAVRRAPIIWSPLA